MVSPLLAEGLDQGVDITLTPHRHTRGQLDPGREAAFLNTTPPGGAAYGNLAEYGWESIEFFSRFLSVRGHVCFQKALQISTRPKGTVLHKKFILAIIPRFFRNVGTVSFGRWLLKTSLVRWRGLWGFSPLGALGLYDGFPLMVKNTGHGTIICL